ncbi:MAG: cupredoxin domain-containing protein, partial [bacterium]
TVGGTVTWTWNSGGVSHSTTSGACSPNCMPDGRWDSGVHSTPNTFSFTFTSAGTYPYYCSFHGASMTGTVQVNPPAFAIDWIEQLYLEGITGGCGSSPPAGTPTPTPLPTRTPQPTPYYPGAHGQMAVLLTKALDLP